MAKDKMMQQANWEKKKDKLDRKRDSERGSARRQEKDVRKTQKEQKQRELKDANNSIDLEGPIYKTGAMASVTVALVYAGLMRFVMNLDVAYVLDIGGRQISRGTLQACLTALAVVSLTIVAGIVRWRLQVVREEQQREAGNLIKGQLERMQTEKERTEQAAERRVQQLKEAKERMKRRTEAEASALNQAKELARALRLRREEREAAEARARAQAKHTESEERDAHGWTGCQYQSLRDAALKYPEGWSHARKKRWEMIASEVDGHDARACEATFARIETEARAAASDAKAESRKDAKASAGSKSLENDFDWLADGGDGGAFGEDGFAGEDDDDYDFDEDEEEDDGSRERMAVEIEPEHKGTEIRLEGIKAMQGCATVQVEVLHLQISCADCRTDTRVFLSGADEDAADVKTWCEGCSGLIAVRLRPTLLHQASTRLCYVDCVRCNVTDMLPSVLTSACESCNALSVHKQEFARNKTISGTCLSCHAKYGFGAESIRIEAITPCEPGGGNRSRERKSSEGDDDPMEEIAEELRYLRKKAKSDPRQQLIKLGSPLPQMGACKHFKKSFKWYRFACCGRAFPCPECHVESGCPAAGLGALANRMICGKCSMEQSYNPARPCEKCNFIMQAKGSKHWDDGAGTRNLAAMSTKDAKKFKGGLRQATSKTKTASNKSDRVGAKAKAKREHAKKFGREG